jgi:hypothetical protein
MFSFRSHCKERKQRSIYEKAVPQDYHAEFALSYTIFFASKPFAESTPCHSEGAKRPKNLLRISSHSREKPEQMVHYQAASHFLYGETHSRHNHAHQSRLFEFIRLNKPSRRYYLGNKKTYRAGVSNKSCH